MATPPPTSPASDTAATPTPRWRWRRRARDAIVVDDGRRGSRVVARRESCDERSVVVTVMRWARFVGAAGAAVDDGADRATRTGHRVRWQTRREVVACRLSGRTARGSTRIRPRSAGGPAPPTRPGQWWR